MQIRKHERRLLMLVGLSGIVLRSMAAIIYHLTTGTRYHLLLQTYLSKSSPLFSACIDPLFSLDQLKHEATIRHFLKESATNSYHSNHLAAPPILVYIFELLSEFNERYTGLLHLLISFLLGFVDLTISYLLYEVAIIGIKSSSKEIELEGFMPRQIRPPRAWVFGIKLPKVLPKVDVQAEENIQQLRLSAAKIDSNCVVDETSKRNEVHTKQEHEYDATIDLESYIDYQDIPSIAASLYLLNPITILSSSCMLSMQSLGPLFILLALASSYKGRYHNSAWWIACSSAFEQSPYPLLILLIPLLSLSLHRFDRLNSCYFSPGNILVSLIVSHYLLTYFSVKALPYKNTSISMLLKHQTNRWSFANLTPNPGLQWYLFTQVFHQFRFYCTQIMVGMPFVWVAPLTLRLYHYPLELVRHLTITISGCMFDFHSTYSFEIPVAGNVISAFMANFQACLHIL